MAVWEIADEVGISVSSTDNILKDDLGMHRVPMLRSLKQRQLCVVVSEDMLRCSNRIGGNETWVYGDDLDAKFQSSQWKHSSSPRAKKAHRYREK